MKSKIFSYIQKHEAWRAKGINLVASENTLSTKVRAALASNLAGRYHGEWYGGAAVARKIIEETEALARKLFRARHAIVTAPSGNLCDLAVLFAFTAPQEKIAMVPFSAGGYPFGLQKFHRERVDLPVDPSDFSIDVGKTREILAEDRVKLTILGASCILFPHPVREISDGVRRSKHGGHCVYDGSHVLGLIACGAFQDPLREGAEILFGSTHKSFYGPQGGILLTDSSSHAAALRKLLDIDLETGIGLVDNPHVNRVAALGIAMEEMLDDPEYGRKAIEHAKALGRALDNLGVSVRFKHRGFTQSHQILLDLDRDRAKAFCAALEQIGVFIDIGGRIGLTEITHRGMGNPEIQEIAGLMAEVYHEGARPELKKRVEELADSWCEESPQSAESMQSGIQKIFSEVPATYELVNHVLTFGLDILWRRKAVKIAVAEGGTRWLDVCSGTGETAFYLSRRAGKETLVAAADFSFPMLSRAAAKPEGHRIAFTLGNARALPFPDSSFDLVTISFATRNINTNRETLTKCFREFCRILKPGGRFVNLETSQPPSKIVRTFFHLYVRLAVKPVGQLISGSKAGYTYLSQTIPRFYDPHALKEILLKAGFGKVDFKPFLLGAAAVHKATK